MKCVFIIIITLLILASCKSREVKPVELKVAAADSLNIQKKKFDGVVFASKKDLSCGMPLSAGLEDTVHYKSKIYGFCSKECKDDFIQHAAAYTKQSK